VPSVLCVNIKTLAVDLPLYMCQSIEITAVFVTPVRLLSNFILEVLHFASLAAGPTDNPSIYPLIHTLLLFGGHCDVTRSLNMQALNFVTY